MFELSATDTQALTIEFEVPAGMSSSGSTGGYEESMMSVQLDLASNAEVKSTLFCTGDKDYIPETFLDKVIQRYVLLLATHFTQCTCLCDVQNIIKHMFCF